MATTKQIKAAKKIVENRGNVSKGMRDAGYSPKTAKNPKNLTDSKAWPDLVEEFLPDADLARVHKALLHTHRIEHMVFPLKVTDKDIRALLASVNCKVRKIMHGETAIHCWFWSPDATAQKNAVELAYKIKGRITNKIEAEVKGELAVALVEFIGNEEPPAEPPKEQEITPPPAEEVAPDAPTEASQSPNN